MYLTILAETSLQFRLAQRDSENSGIVEVFNGVSEWGCICGATGWTIENADAICRHLGYPWAFSHDLRRPERQKNIFIRSMGCRSSNGTLDVEQCEKYTWHRSTCLTQDVAGVVCFTG